MTVARSTHRATLLPSGKVLIVGANRGPEASAELYDPAVGTFTRTGSMTVGRDGGTATLLANGKVLLAGGQVVSGGDFLASAEVYDPAVGTFTPTGSMTAARADHTATLLGTGMVLITGGGDLVAPGYHFPSAELYDPATGTFTATGSLTVPRQYYTYTATSLLDGRVLIVGGTDNTTGQSFASAELYTSSPN
jgi:hypothetical protein